ncbi:MAG: mandelate racemase/muconate lactonizing enzyme family protein [Candidatus Latescibacterota bacterium]|nr:mandelate racemase/muconate lactonizing enzyme family protein [Candidatus Latescibacterota bacterium]
MKITEIKATIVAGSRPWVYVRVATDEGLYGLAEAYPVRGVIGVLHSQLEELLIGQDPLAIEPLYNHLLARTPGQSTGGTTLAAISAVEIALWDIKGKALGVPVYQLLGGAYRNRLRLYADVGHGTRMDDTTQAWADRAKEGLADGFSAIKFDIDHSADEHSLDPVNRGLSLAELDKMEALMAAAREAVGPGLDICIDCHGLYSVRDALLLAERLAPYNLMFLEDPVPPENAEAMAKVTAGTPIPICTGEFLHRRDGFRALIEAQACDMLHIDAASTGGLLEAKKIADMADLYYMPCAFHNIVSPLGLAASAHVCAAVRNLHTMELPYHADQVPWRWDIVETDGPLVEDGFFNVPQGPGIGVELNADIARAHLRPGHTFFD